MPGSSAGQFQLRMTNRRCSHWVTASEKGASGPQMRADVEHSIRTLDRYWALCDGVEGPLLVARLYELARFMQSSELLRQSYRAAQEESETSDPDRFLRNVMALLWERVKPS